MQWILLTISSVFYAIRALCSVSNVTDSLGSPGCRHASTDQALRPDYLFNEECLEFGLRRFRHVFDFVLNYLTHFELKVSNLQLRMLIVSVSLINSQYLTRFFSDGKLLIAVVCLRHLCGFTQSSLCVAFWRHSTAL